MSSKSVFVSLGTAHLQRLMEIERCSFGSPWTAGDFVYLFGEQSALCLGLLYDGELIGYALGHCRGCRFHLSSLAVDPSFRRRGWAWKLLEQILSLAADRGANRCRLEVRSTNLAALAFYDKVGFWPVERREAYYRDPPDDGIIMEYSIEVL